MSFKQWIVPQNDIAAAKTLAADTGINDFLALLLLLRGVTTGEDAGEFLTQTEWTADPFAFVDMDVAAERVQRAIDDQEWIMVYGDYDADGVTATALLYSYLKEKDARVLYMLPSRDGDGYGLHRPAIDDMIKLQIRLIITVDNGISAIDEIAYARENGIDVVVTDHHQVGEKMPDAVAVVDPHRADCPSPYKNLSGVEMAFELVCALEGDADEPLRRYADLCTIGLLADVMPLTGPNRVMVRYGLKSMRENHRVGIEKLREAAGISARPLTATGVVFTIAPRINAAGRMGEADKSVDLLLSAEPQEADLLANAIQALNAKRQETESTILKEVDALLDAHPERMHQRVMVVAGNGWHHGVIGIIAARLQERYGRPCLVLSVDGTVAKGSGRSLPGFSLFQALTACKDLLLTFGGHELAAGLSLEAEKLPAFSQAINAYAATACPQMPVMTLSLDCKIRPGQITTYFVDLLSCLEPFGIGNPSPLFGLYQMQLVAVNAVGNGKHLRLTLRRDGTELTVMKFNTLPEEFGFVPGDVLNLAVRLDKNEFRGVTTVSILAQDIRLADTCQEDFLTAQRQLDAVMCRETPEGTVTAPTREEIAVIYRFLARAGSWCGSWEQLCYQNSALSPLTVRLILEVLREGTLIACFDDGNQLHISVNPHTGKVDLTQTPLMVFLRKAGEPDD